MGIVEEEGGQDLRTSGVRERVKTGIASGTEVPTITGLACSRHCQRVVTRPSPRTFPCWRVSKALSSVLIYLCGTWRESEVGGREGRHQARILMGCSPERDGSWEPGPPSPSQDSPGVELVLGCQAKVSILD